MLAIIVRAWRFGLSRSELPKRPSRAERCALVGPELAA